MLRKWLASLFKQNVKAETYIPYSEAVKKLNKPSDEIDTSFSPAEWRKLEPPASPTISENTHKIIKSMQDYQAGKIDVYEVLEISRSAMTPEQITDSERRTKEHNSKVQRALDAWARIGELKHRGYEVPYRQHRAAHQIDIQNYNDMNITHVRVNPWPKQPCPACADLMDKIYPKYDEQRRPQLPVIGCTCLNGECNCFYTAVWRDEI